MGAAVGSFIGEGTLAEGSEVVGATGSVRAAFEGIGSGFVVGSGSL